MENPVWRHLNDPGRFRKQRLGFEPGGLDIPASLTFAKDSCSQFMGAVTRYWPGTTACTALARRLKLVLPARWLKLFDCKCDPMFGRDGHAPALTNKSALSDLLRGKPGCGHLLEKLPQLRRNMVSSLRGQLKIQSGAT